MDWAFARWIWLDGDGRKYNQHVVFQRDFRLDRLPSKAELFITADSSYRLRVNGQWSADGPARAYPEHYSFDTVDCSNLLRNGLNRIEADVHYFGCGTFKGIWQRGGLLAVLKLYYPDGSVECIGTDSSWRAAEIPQKAVRTLKRSVQLEQLEYFDASVGQAPEFVPATVVCDPEGGPWKNLYPRATPMLTRREALFRRVSEVSLVGKEYRTLMLNPHEIIYPGNTGVNNCDTAIIFCAAEFNSRTSGEITLALSRAAAAVNGRKVEKNKPVPVREGKNFVVFSTNSFRGHAHASFGIGFAPSDDIEFGRMVKAAVPELSGRTPDVPSDWANETFRERGEKFYEMLKDMDSIGSMDDFFSAFPSASELTADDLFSDAGAISFQNRTFRTAPAGVVENPQALIYPDDRCTVIHPVADADVELLCDLGVQNIGYWNFVINAPAGTVVDIYAVEYIDDAGELQHTGDGYFNCMRYVCRDGWNRFTSSARRSGRYVFVTLRRMTGDVKIQSLRLVESTYPAVPCGEFHSSDRDLDRIFEISERTLKLCMEDTFVDCPLYEQTFWVGDARNESLFALSCFGAPDLVKHCIELAGESLDGIQLLGCQVPSGWKCSIPAFGFMWTLALKDIYRELGDGGFLKKLYPVAMRLIKNAEAQIDPANGLMKSLEWNLFEWSGVSIRKPYMLYNSLLFKGALDALADLADAAGAEPGTAEYCRTLAGKLTDAVNLMWDDRKLAYYESMDFDGSREPEYSMHTSMLALLFDVIPENRRASACANIVSPRTELKKIVSPFACQLWFEALEKLGMEELIVERLRSDYSEMLEYGATTVWETFPGRKKSGSGYLTRSHCHAWSSVPLYMLPRVILGLRADNGCRKFTVSPLVNSLEYASGARWTPFGPVRVNWRKAEGVLFIDVAAPPEVEVEFKDNLSLREYEVKFNVERSKEV